MKRFILLLFVTILLAAALDPRFKKGDTWYISGAFDFVRIDVRKTRITREERRVPPCTPWKVTGSIDDPAAAIAGERVQRTTLASIFGDRLCLRGDWSKVAFRVQKECESGPAIGPISVESGACLSLGGEAPDSLYVLY